MPINYIYLVLYTLCQKSVLGLQKMFSIATSENDTDCQYTVRVQCTLFRGTTRIVQKARDSTRKSEKHELIREVSRTMLM